MNEDTIRISKFTVERLLDTGRQRFRRAHKAGYTFKHIALPAEDQPLPEYHEVALSRDKMTLYIRRASVQCLHDTGSVTCQFGEKNLITFLTEGGQPLSVEVN